MQHLYYNAAINYFGKTVLKIKYSDNLKIILISKNYYFQPMLIKLIFVNGFL